MDVRRVVCRTLYSKLYEKNKKLPVIDVCQARNIHEFHQSLDKHLSNVNLSL